MTAKFDASWEDMGHDEWDCVVIGAGPAGAMAARQMALLGGHVLLVERKAFPRKKVCGGCLSPRAVDHLNAVGLGEMLNGVDGQRLNEFRLSSRTGTLRMPLPGGVAVSRAKFDAALVSAAIDAGAKFLPETSATVGECGDGSRTIILQRTGAADRTALFVWARVIVAADGLGHPCLASLPEFAQESCLGSRIGAACEIAGCEANYLPGVIYMAVGHHGYVGQVVVEGNQLNVAAAFDPHFVRECGGLGAAAASVLREAKMPPIPGLPEASWQGTPALTRNSSMVGAERIFLIGDAAGYIEPFTGEGIAWALAAGQELAPLAKEGWSSWDRRLEKAWTLKYAHCVARQQRVCRLMARLLRSQTCVGLAIAALDKTPWLTGKLIEWFYSPIKNSSSSYSPCASNG